VFEESLNNKFIIIIIVIRRVTGLNFVVTVEVILWVEHSNEFTRSAFLLVYKFVE